MNRGFEPFGTDYQAGTGNGASDYGIPLRLPGQWVDDTWLDATSGAGVYYSPWRYLETQTGRYLRPDPLGARNERGIASQPYGYASLNPLSLVDPLGLYTAQGNSRFKDEVTDAMERISKALNNGSECCLQYFHDRGVDLKTWAQPGGPPYIRQGQSAEFRTASGAKACGKPQTGAPFLYLWINWDDCFQKPDPCLLSSTILHELGHLARHDAGVDNEPADFFKVCTLDSCTQPGVRGD